MFTTGLRAGDLAVTGIAGLRPIGPVTGAGVLRSDFIHGNGRMTGSPGRVYLYPESVAVVRTTRAEAVRQMAGNAAALGADAVVGIQVSHKERRWYNRNLPGGVVESVASGIAVAWPDRPPRGGAPVLTNLDVQGCWKLFQSGYVPAGLVMSTIMTGCIARRLRTGPSVDALGARQWPADQYPDAAAMVTIGYRTMNEEIREQGQAMGAEGIIGVEFQRRKWGYEFVTRNSGVMCRQFKMIGTVIGTAVVPDESAARQTGLRITPVRHAT
jgi:uncharacterized protein YbjQ (UPF0145 family)